VKKQGHYAGISGIMRLDDLVACSRAFEEALRSLEEGAAPELKFMAGFLLSSKTLVGESNRFPKRYPPISRLPELLSFNAPFLLRTIHYNTKDAATLPEQIDRVMAIAPGEIDAIQLNIRWASPVQLRRIRRRYPDLRIILQVGAGALSDVEEPDDIFLGDALKSYDGVVDDYLVDPSGGEGKPLDIWKAFACVSDDEIPSGMLTGVAGGRCAANVHELVGLMRRLKRPVNMDAEGRLRTPAIGTILGDDLDLAEATAYLREAVYLIGTAMQQYRVAA